MILGIRAPKQNASAVVASAAGGEIVTIADRGRSVAQLTAVTKTRLESRTDARHASPATRQFADLEPLGSITLTEVASTVFEEAGRLGPGVLRSLDAIHLATRS